MRAPQTARGQRLLSGAAGVLLLLGLVGAGVAAGTYSRTTPASEVQAAPARSPALVALTVGAPKGALILPDNPTRDVTAQQAPSEALVTGLAANGIPNVVLNAYLVAAKRMAANDPGCGIDWSLLAGIGRVESNQARFGGSVPQPDGSVTPPIIGPALDGNGFAYIADTDHGVWDKDTVYDRAVGPMQFIPATFRAYGVSANGGSNPDPNNVNDAALAAARYLCTAGGDLHTYQGQYNAVMAYNHSDSYVKEVLALAAAYAAGIPVADLPISGDTTSPLPPVDRSAAGLPASPMQPQAAQYYGSDPNSSNVPTTYMAGQQPPPQQGAQPNNAGGPPPGDQNGGAPVNTPAGGPPATGPNGGPPAPNGGPSNGGGPLPGGPALPAPPPPPPVQAPAPPPPPPPPPPPTVLSYNDPICVAFRGPLHTPVPTGLVCPSSP